MQGLLESEIRTERLLKVRLMYLVMEYTFPGVCKEPQQSLQAYYKY
jgi:hypothetical protein